MTTAKFRNIAIYVAIGIAIFLVTDLGKAIEDGLMPGFRDGETFAAARERIGDLIALLAATGGMWLAANRPRFGSEGLSQQVKSLQADGVPRSDMSVLSPEQIKTLQDEAARVERVRLLREAARVQDSLKAADRG